MASVAAYMVACARHRWDQVVRTAVAFSSVVVLLVPWEACRPKWVVAELHPSQEKLEACVVVCGEVSYDHRRDQREKKW